MQIVSEIHFQLSGHQKTTGRRVRSAPARQLKALAWLERHFPAQLPEPWLVRTGRSTKAPIRYVCVRVCIVCPVKKVEEFEPDLKIHTFCDRRVFVDVRI